MSTTIIVAPGSSGSSSRGLRWCILSLWYNFFSLLSFFLFLLYVYSHLTCFPLYLSLVFATTVYLLTLLFYLRVHSIESQKCIYVSRHIISRSKKNKSPKYGRDILCHPVSGDLEYFLKSNHSLYYLYIIKYVLVYSIWWSEALLWRPPFFFFTACSWTN